MKTVYLLLPIILLLATGAGAQEAVSVGPDMEVCLEPACGIPTPSQPPIRGQAFEDCVYSKSHGHLISIRDTVGLLGSSQLILVKANASRVCEPQKKADELTSKEADEIIHRAMHRAFTEVFSDQV